MDAKSNGGPAFPHPNPDYSQDYGVDRPFGGMSLRDYIAIAAMQAMTSSPALFEVVTSGSILDGTYFDRCSKRAYQQADAMLEARDK